MQNIIQENYQRVLDRIEKAVMSAGRNPRDIRLVVVTKTHPIDVIQSLINCGVKDFGENYIEEAMPKIISFISDNDIRWHMIGHIQSRKAKSVCQYFNYIHSLDSVFLAERLNRFELSMSKKIPTWVEVNVSGEETKYGWNISVEENWENIMTDFEKIVALKTLDIIGLMTLPPYSLDPEASRPYYKRLRKFQEYVINHFKLTGFRELSMGMSSDFEVAIQEGSTCVRIGQAILGPRAV